MGLLLLMGAYGYVDMLYTVVLWAKKISMEITDMLGFLGEDE